MTSAADTMRLDAQLPTDVLDVMTATWVMHALTLRLVFSFAFTAPRWGVITGDC